jgi:hypothetical protein
MLEHNIGSPSKGSSMGHPIIRERPTANQRPSALINRAVD